MACVTISSSSCMFVVICKFVDINQIKTHWRHLWLFTLNPALRNSRATELILAWWRIYIKEQGCHRLLINYITFIIDDTSMPSSHKWYISWIAQLIRNNWNIRIPISIREKILIVEWVKVDKEKFEKQRHGYGASETNGFSLFTD